MRTSTRCARFVVISLFVSRPLCPRLLPACIHQQRIEELKDLTLLKNPVKTMYNFMIVFFNWLTDSFQQVVGHEHFPVACAAAAAWYALSRVYPDVLGKETVVMWPLPCLGFNHSRHVPLADLHA